MYVFVCFRWGGFFFGVVLILFYSLFFCITEIISRVDARTHTTRRPKFDYSKLELLTKLAINRAQLHKKKRTENRYARAPRRAVASARAALTASARRAQRQGKEGNRHVGKCAGDTPLCLL